MNLVWKIILFLQFLGLSLFAIRATALNGKFIRLAKGHRLINSLIKKTEATSATHCIQMCLTEGLGCQSINYLTTLEGEGKCQLNSKLYEVFNAGKLVADQTSEFYQRSQGKDFYRPTRSCHMAGFSVRSCAELYKRGERKNGVYKVFPDALGAINVRCDMTTNGGGWTVFQRRVDGSVDFYLGWKKYKEGFGDLNGEFWLGLNKIHRLSKSGENVLRVDLEDFENVTRYAEYSKFLVGDERTKYILRIRGYSGDAGDSLQFHNAGRFSTKDEDNDMRRQKNCAKLRKGAWWYKDCQRSNLNGRYLRGKYTTSNRDGVSWHSWKGPGYSLKKTEMKMRPASL